MCCELIYSHLLAAPSTKKRIAEPADSPSDTYKVQKHGLSKEMQFYYEKIVEAILGESEELKNLAFESVRQDSAIRYLTPYLVRLITEKILKNMNNLKITNSMLRLIRAILINQNVPTEAYLHQVIPNVLTCLVGKDLCRDPREDHWSLRAYASKLVAHICKKYSTVYAMLQTRVTKTLLHALLGPEKTLSTNYGAIVGLHALGPEAIRLFLIPSLFELKGKLSKAFNSSDSANGFSADKIDAEKCYGAAVDALFSYYEFLMTKGDIGAGGASSVTADIESNVDKHDKDSKLSEMESEIRAKHPFFAEKIIEKLHTLPQL